MYTLLLISCILALTFCPLLLDLILTRRETRQQKRFARGRSASGLTLANQRSN